MEPCTRIDAARAVLNLISLGFDTAHALAIMADWANRQRAQSIQHIDQLATNTSLEVDPALDDESTSRLYASFHCGSYPLLYRHLSRRVHPPRVMSLIGSQSDHHQQHLREIALRHGTELEFVRSSPSMVRRLQRAFRAGIRCMLLVDIPWSKEGGGLDVEYPVPGGRFLGRRSLDRLLHLLDPAYHFAVASRSPHGVKLEDLGHVSLATAYEWLGHQLQMDPAGYERLHQFHAYFRFDRPSDTLACFNVGDEHYMLHGNGMKAWRMSPTLRAHIITLPSRTPLTDPALLRNLSTVTHVSVQSVVRL